MSNARVSREPSEFLGQGHFYKFIIVFARHVLRLAPVSASCVASAPEILVLAQKLIPSAFASLPEKLDGSRNYRVSNNPDYRSFI